MPGFLGGSSAGSGGTGGEILFPKEFIDPVTKLRVSQPENLIDTDFEYGLQPTKWETVELINNTPSFFSKSGDTTIDGIQSIITNNGTREITVTTGLDHGLAVGIPISVTGTRSVTADGSYIINSIPNPQTFTYLCKDNQIGDNSIEDLYTSIITGEFFQGSQIRVANAEGVTTDGEAISTLTVTTESTHGFGVNTPFYFLNLNSTISQEFEAANTAAKSFDASNSATAQTFDGSNTLSSFNIDWSNSATVGGSVSTVTSVSTANNTIAVSHTTEPFSGLVLGQPLYYDVTTSTGYFANNPRGVVFLKSTDSLGSSTSTFQVSAVPDGDVIPIEASMSGTFQIANQARTFAGNNINEETQQTFSVIIEDFFGLEGANDGGPESEGVFVNGNPLSTLANYSGSLVNVTVAAGAGLGYYPGAMLRYSTTGSAATGLTNNTTYFIDSFFSTGTDTFAFTIKALPTDATPITISGGTGTQTFRRIGVSPDKDVWHFRNSNFIKGDMIEYVFPESGAVSTDSSKVYFFVDTVYDAHNYLLSDSLFSITSATGGTISTLSTPTGDYRVHTFTSVGTTNFVVSSVGTIPTIEYLIVGGGGAGAARHGGGGGAGGFIEGTRTATVGTFPIVIGAGATGTFSDTQGPDGGSTTAFSLTAIGGGGGGSWGQRNGRPGGSGGGGSEVSPNGGVGGTAQQPGSASGGFGFAGAISQQNGTGHGSGGGGAGAVGTRAFDSHAGPGGSGRRSTILGQTYFFAGGGGGGSWEAGEPRRGGPGGLGGAGGGGQARSGVAGQGGGVALNNGQIGTVGIPNSRGGDAGANTGGGGGGGGAYPPNIGYENTKGGNGGSGIVVIRYRITPPFEQVFTEASGGTITTETEGTTTYRVHTFTAVGQSAFSVTRIGTDQNIEIFAYGAGGGGGQPGGWSFGARGGAGGFATARHQLTTLKSYAVMVGGGGANAFGTNNGLSSLVFTQGGGAPSRPDGNDNRYGGQGGGLSGFFDNNTYDVANAILIAGGGGAGGSSRAQIGNIGGAGGGLVGEDGTAPYDGQTERRGRGGGQTGPTPLPVNGNAIIPTQLRGGVTANYGGGGGGGWWGGSAGTYTESNTMGGGGGGSSYANPSKTTFAQFQSGSGLYPPPASFRTGTIAAGGEVSSVGGNGVVIIRYPIAILA
jgi:hypothetical protein